MFDNLVSQIPRCLNVVIAPIWDKLFGHKVLNEPIVVFGIIVNIEIVEAFITSDRVAYFCYRDALSFARFLQNFGNCFRWSLWCRESVHGTQRNR
jgi:hypothetical protein